MQPRLSALLRFLRLSIVVIGLMQLGAVSVSASAPDLSGSPVQSMKQAPAPLLHAARPSQLAILTGIAAPAPSAVAAGGPDLQAVLPRPGTGLCAPWRAARTLAFAAAGTRGTGAQVLRPGARAPPFVMS